MEKRIKMLRDPRFQARKAMAWKRQVALLALTMAASIALADAAKGKKKGGKAAKSPPVDKAGAPAEKDPDDPNQVRPGEYGRWDC